jgi:hypothetical protein
MVVHTALQGTQNCQLTTILLHHWLAVPPQPDILRSSFREAQRNYYDGTLIMLIGLAVPKIMRPTVLCMVGYSQASKS